MLADKLTMEIKEMMEMCTRTDSHIRRSHKMCEECKTELHYLYVSPVYMYFKQL